MSPLAQVIVFVSSRQFHGKAEQHAYPLIFHASICKKCRGVLKDLENGTSESAEQVLEEEMEKLALVKIG